VEYSKIKKDYTINDYETEKCGNIYAFIVERTLKLIRKEARLGLIIPISVISTDRTESIQKILKNKCRAWYINFDTIPGRLFGKEVEQRLTIALFDFDISGEIYTSYYRRFSPIARETLFPTIQFQRVTDIYKTGFIP